MANAADINRVELARYLDRVGDRWPIERALLGGPRVGGVEAGAEGPEYVLILVSSAYDGVPWLERVYQAGALWDAHEMAGAADIHCYTPVEFDRKRQSLDVVRETADSGVELIGAG